MRRGVAALQMVKARDHNTHFVCRRLSQTAFTRSHRNSKQVNPSIRLECVSGNNLGDVTHFRANGMESYLEGESRFAIADESQSTHNDWNNVIVSHEN
jgi:hypothetical protein